MTVPVAEGGVMGSLAGLDPTLADYVTFEEYPVQPESYTLNGFLAALLGLYDWWQLEPAQSEGPHARARELFLAGVESAKRVLPYHDVGGFTSYDLGFLVWGSKPNLAPGYHARHVYLLHALYSITGDPVFAEFEQRWGCYVAPVPECPPQLRADPPGPSDPGEPVRFAAAADDGVAREFRFVLRSPAGEWSVVRDWAEVSAWSWETAAAAPGVYYVRLDTRGAGSGEDRDAARIVAYRILPVPSTGVTLEANPAQSAAAGTPVTLTASGIGGSGSYEFRFWLRSASGTWAVVQAYSTRNTWLWDTASAAPGPYFVQVDVRSETSPADREASKVLSFEIAASGPSR
jgi:hypothetical protein